MSDKLDGILTPAHTGGRKHVFLIVPKGTKKYTEFAKYRCVGDNTIKSMSFFEQARELYGHYDDFKVYGATEEICNRFGVELEPLIAERTKKPRGKKKSEESTDDSGA